MKLVHRTKPILGHGDYNFERDGYKYRNKEWHSSNFGPHKGVRGMMDMLTRKTNPHHAGNMAMSYY